MFLTEKIKQYLSEDFQVRGEREVEALALLAQNPGVPYGSFLADLAYMDLIGENVKMLFVDPEVGEKLGDNNDFGLIITEDPRNMFFKLHNAMEKDEEYIRPSFETRIGENCNIHPSAVISPKNVIIGDNVTIEEFVSVKEYSVIGEGSILRAGARIGMTDFEFKRDGDAIFGVPHLGGVILGKEVEVQTNSSINRAVYPWDNTEIGDFTKIDDLVHIAHGCKIGKSVMIVANSGIGGRVEIGDKAWIGFGSTIRNGITIGKEARVNMGSVVTRSVEDGQAVTGNFAIPHHMFIEQIKKTKGEE